MHSSRPIDLRQVAAATAVTLAVVSVVGFAYLLLDILLLLFAGIVLAAALQPAHLADSGAPAKAAQGAA